MAKKQMDDATLRKLLDQNIQQSTVWASETVRDEQLRNLRYYLGYPMGNEVPHRSQVVSWDVFEIIESAMPGFIEPFFSGDNIGEFAPRGPEDEAFAAQATDYVNYLIKDDNPGFLIFNTWIKDALLSKIGIVRAEWEQPDPEKVVLEGLTDEQLAQVAEAPGITLTGYKGRPDPDVPPEVVMQMAAVGQPAPMLHDVSFTQRASGRVKIENVRPENFIVSRGAPSIERSRICGEVVTYTRSELVEMGLKRAMEVQDFDASMPLDLTRDRDEDNLPKTHDESTDPSMREVKLFRGFIKADVDGDGVAEWRFVLAGGGPDDVLENEEAHGPDYCVLTPIPIPHRVVGMAYADPASGIQDLKTALTRQYLDGLYAAAYPKTYVNTQAKVRIDDLISTRIGGVVRGEGPANTAIQPLQTTVVSRDALEGLQLADGMRETRLGITRYNQGLDAESLNKTASGIQKVMNAADKRQLMTLRIMAETGIKELFRLVLRLTCEHQDRARTIKLRNQWVPFNPSEWPADMNCTIAVGIGSGDKTETLMQLQQFWGFMQQAASAGVTTPQNVYEFGLMLAKNAKLKGADTKLLVDPSKQPSKPPQPSPDQVKAKAEADRVMYETTAAADEAEKDRQFELQKLDRELDARRNEKMLELAAGILAAQAQAAQGIHDPRNLINGTNLDQTAQSVPLSSMDLASVTGVINQLAGGLQQ